MGHLILLVFAFVLFCLGAFPATEPYRARLIAGGLACLVAAELFGAWLLK